MAKKKTNKDKQHKNKQVKKKEPNFLVKWWDSQKERKPILKFAMFLFLIMILFFIIRFSSFFINYIQLPIVTIYAALGNGILQVMGQDTILEGHYIKSSMFDMNIEKGCDAISPTVLFMAAMALYPTDFSNKKKWLLIAPFAFALLNLIRIVSLFLIGAYLPAYFDFAHIEFWQGLFILITILAWFYWLISVLNKGTVKQ